MNSQKVRLEQLQTKKNSVAVGVEEIELLIKNQVIFNQLYILNYLLLYQLIVTIAPYSTH